jgi:hypothetical protein
MTDRLGGQEEKPLDPAVDRVQKRLRRLMLVAGLTLGLGFLAVFAGIMYRVFTTDSGAPPALPKGAATPTISLSELGLSPDARVISTSLDGDRLALTFAEGGGTTVIVFDLATMAVVARLSVPAE